MTDFFKNNPMVLRHCIRFEILQGNSIEQAYSNICSVIGEEVIDFKKVKIRFNHFSKKKFNDKEGEKPCAKILRDDKYALRVCILYESLKYRSGKISVPVFEVFVNFCKVIGVEEVLKYPEFEFWFYRFLNGEFDLNYERDEEKKIYELMDMPIDVMKNVVEYLDIFDRVNLVQTSRSLQTFVEDQKLFHHTLKLSVFSPRVTISFSESVGIKYRQSGDDCLKNYKKHETIVRGVDCSDKAILDFTSVLKNPRLHLDTLEIEFRVDDVMYLDDEFVLSDLKDALKFTHYLNVKNLIIVEYSWEFLEKIVPMLKPGYLTTIDINSSTLYDLGGSMKKVFETEQWKRAKCFFMDGTFFMWPLHHLYHFEKFTVSLEKLSVENIRQMKETLFTSPNFEKCSIWVDDDIKANAIGKEFGVGTWEDENNPEFMKIYRYPFANSTDYFEVKVEAHHFEVTRKKK